MPLDIPAVRERLKTFNFTALFTQELGWDFPASSKTPLTVTVNEQPFVLQPIAQKRGVPVYLHQPTGDDVSPDYPTRRIIHKEVRKSAHEHLIIFVHGHKTTQTWQWVAYRPGQPPAYREHSYTPATQSGDALIQKLATISVPISEEESIDLTGAVQKLRDAFNREKVTKRFYDRFKTEHAAFLQLIKGIKAEGDLEWYTSLMLNRLMFVYFIQKKGFLDGDNNYLRTRMKKVRALQGTNKFLSFYRYFLTRLFHDGLGTHQKERTLEPELEILLGWVPYLNGGFFEVHPLEERNPKIEIPDEAFERLFNFFDEFSWHLDDRPLREGNEINPDVVGYIFEKYINQKQMGAYYTKEDITEYISKNTIIPFLFDAARKQCAAAFKRGSSIWTLLSDNPDRYIYAAVRHGVIDDQGNVIPLPNEIAAGINTVAKRDKWNRPATAPFALPTETWREHVSRRQQCLELREKLQKGEVTETNELITLNLDIWQFARDVILNCESPELLRAFWHAIQTVTVLDPTCGSGAFLFAALNILETLYSDCLEAMGRIVQSLPSKAASTPDALKGETVAETAIAVTRGRGTTKSMERFSDFTSVLSQIYEHRGQKYFILKSIIINNLYGVDMMEEAVEICKLRLFLKLIAQVEHANQIEPLPDIDFNIRAGNTLVGYVSLDEVRSARATESAGSSKQKLLLDDDADAEIRRIEEEALVVQRAFEQFRNQQTKHGGNVTSQDKSELWKRLARLDAELDSYLASEYGVESKSKGNARFLHWKRSHQPFHWFVQFYGIMSKGGFDVIVGNPPWKEYSAIKKTYTVRNYASEACGNLHGLCTERAISLRAVDGRLSFIVQLPLVCSSRMHSLRALLQSRSDCLHVVPFDDRPGKLFDGLQHCRSVIFFSASRSQHCRGELLTTRYQRWPTEARNNLFARLEFAHAQNAILHSGVFPKYATDVEVSAFRKVVQKSDSTLHNVASALKTPTFVFYQEATQYWVKAVVGLPYYKKDGIVDAPAHGRYIYFDNQSLAAAACAVMNSSLFYAYFIAYGDCFHLSDTLVGKFPVPKTMLHDARLVDYGNALNTALKQSATQKTIKTRDGSEISYAEFDVAASKQILNGIDECLAAYYGFTSEETEFIIEYDAKYRMKQDETAHDN